MSVILQAEQDPHNKHMKQVYQFAVDKTKELLTLEGIDIPVQLTYHRKTYARHNNHTDVETRERISTPTLIRLGTQMLELAYNGKHSRIFVVSRDQICVTNRSSYKAEAVLSICIEEAAHAIQVHRDGCSNNHGPRFHAVFKELWNRHMDRMLSEYNVLMGGSPTP